jgi:hypothetical protein
MRNLLLPLALLLAACPEQVGQQCPPNTSVVGQYTLNFHAQHPPGECLVTNDGGQPPSPLALDDAGSRAATLCLAGTGDGGLPLLDLVVAGQGGLRNSDVSADGGFHFASAPVVAQGTPCGCDVTDVETLDGFLLTGTDAGFALQPDGGLPPVPALSATLTDHLTATPSPQCLCTFPCTQTYVIVGTRF